MSATEPPQVPHRLCLQQQAFRDPDRLDGYGPQSPSRRRTQEFTGPYFTSDIVPDEVKSVTNRVSDKRFIELAEDELGRQAESTDEEIEDNIKNPIHKTFLTDKAAVLSTLMRRPAKFEVPMAKEWDSWQRFSAVERPEQWPWR